MLDCWNVKEHYKLISQVNTMHMFHLLNPVNKLLATRRSSSKREENLAKVRLEKWSIVTNKPKMQVNLMAAPSTVILWSLRWILDIFVILWALQRLTCTFKRCEVIINLWKKLGNQKYLTFRDSKICYYLQLISLST